MQLFNKKLTYSNKKSTSSLKASKLNNKRRANVYDAKLWITAGFDEATAKSKLGFSDGTSGQGEVPVSIRPAALGAATFEYKVVNGKPCL